MDFSQVGRFGRDPKCSVRLYYSDINLVHCKIIFQERKAFLIVLGPAGLLVDGCRVYPNASPGGKQTTIPLSNNSEIEIHGKRFRFSYPPKEIRATLFATPGLLIALNRKLRLSMIQSAHVFSPAPSQDPRENLRILRSPMKNTFQSPRKPSQFSQSPITATRHNGVIEEQDEEEEEEEEGEEIVLVDGPHPRVVQEEKDLIILEEVDEPVPQPTIQIQPPKTPQRRRSQSLHRAVLIRSAQRAVIEHERQQQEEEEELEVVDTITNADVSSDESPTGTPHTYRSGPSSDEESDSDRDQAPEDTNPDQRKSLWRKSIERIWPFRNSTTEDSEDNKDEEAEEEEESSGEESEDYERDEGQDEPEALPSLSQATPIRRHLGSFMTPQIGNKPVPFDRGESVDSSRGRLAGGPPVRYSLGGDARRVPFDSAWRVKDIVVPVKGAQQESTLPEPYGVPGRSTSPQRPVALGPPQTSPVRSRPEITAEERKAIQERRRSALREVDSRVYFTGGIPGMSPSKATSSSSTSPVKAGFNDFNNPFRPAGGSPVKDGVGRLGSTDEEDEKMDTRSLLERMKETVEGMKRRRSMVGDGLTPGPGKAVLGDNPFEGGGFEQFTLNSLEIQDDDDDDERDERDEAGGEHDDDDDDDDDDEHDEHEHEHEHEHDEDEDEDKENDRNAMDVDEPMVVLRSPNKNQPIPLSPLEAAEDPVVEVSPVVTQEPTVPDSPPHLEDEEVEQPPVQRSNQLQVPLTRGRSRTKSPQVETMASEEPAEAPTVETERRDTRKSTTTPDQEEVPPPVAPTGTRSEVRRVRKPTVGEVDKPQTSRRGRPKTPTVDEVPVAAPKRTSKRAAAVKEEVADVPVVLAPARRGRAPAASKIATRQKSGDRAKRPASRARSGAKTPVDVDDGDDDDNDPLDSIVAVEEPAVLAKSTTTTRGRKPRAGLKKEDSADVLKTSTRARTSTVTTTATASKTPATRGPGRPRKTPATAPPVVTRAMDKENTPEEGDSSAKSSAAADEGVVVKVRTTTKTTAARKTRTAAAVKQEPESGGSGGGGGGGGGARPKTRGTRTTTRTRTKTT